VFGLGETVYLKHDGEANKRMITQVLFTLDGGTQYRLSHGTQDTWHYEQELSLEASLETLLGKDES
jgi:hypothetical protein